MSHDLSVELVMRFGHRRRLVFPVSISYTDIRDCCQPLELSNDPFSLLLGPTNVTQRNYLMQRRRDVAERIAQLLVRQFSENDQVRGYTRQQAPELFNVQDSQGPTFSTHDTVRLDRGNPSDVG